MSASIDLTGRVFGRLTVLGPTDRRESGNVVWRCRCACGQEILVRTAELTRGRTVSCGCYQREIHAQRLRKLDRSGNLVDGTNLHSLARGIQRNNTSGVKGVSYNARQRAWGAYIYIRRQRIHLGWYHTLGDAAAARREAEAEYHVPILDRHKDPEA